MTTLERPTTDEIRAARADANLDRAAAAALVHLGHAVRWAEYETGARGIDLAKWELFLLKTDQHPDLKAPRRRVAA
jgi:hypothetical protein